MSDKSTILPLETPRLTLRPFEEGDLPAFVAYRSDPEVARYQSWSDYDMERAEAFLANQREGAFADPGKWCQIAIVVKGEEHPIGDVVINVLEDDPQQAEFGFTLSTARQGQGYATEAVKGLLAIAFEHLKLHRVYAITDALNEPAAALLRRLGFRQEAHFIEHVFFKGAWGDEFQFALLRREWESQI